MGKTEVILPKDPAELRYLDLTARTKIDKAKEDMQERIISKVKSNPFIPIGIIATTTIITLGIRQFFKRNTLKQQYYMRARVASQALTFASFFAGSVYYHYKKKEDKEEIDYNQF